MNVIQDGTQITIKKPERDFFNTSQPQAEWTPEAHMRRLFKEFIDALPDEDTHEYYCNAIGDFLDWTEEEQ